MALNKSAEGVAPLVAWVALRYGGHAEAIQTVFGIACRYRRADPPFIQLWSCMPESIFFHAMDAFEATSSPEQLLNPKRLHGDGRVAHTLTACCRCRRVPSFLYRACSTLTITEAQDPMRRPSSPLFSLRTEQCHLRVLRRGQGQEYAPRLCCLPTATGPGPGG